MRCTRSHATPRTRLQVRSQERARFAPAAGTVHCCASARRRQRRRRPCLLQLCAVRSSALEARHPTRAAPQPQAPPKRSLLPSPRLHHCRTLPRARIRLPTRTRRRDAIRPSVGRTHPTAPHRRLSRAQPAPSTCAMPTAIAHEEFSAARQLVAPRPWHAPRQVMAAIRCWRAYSLLTSATSINAIARRAAEPPLARIRMPDTGLSSLRKQRSALHRLAPASRSLHGARGGQLRLVGVAPTGARGGGGARPSPPGRA